MLRIVLPLAAAALCGGLHGAAVAQDAKVRFDRPIFTTEGAVLCARQEHIALLRRASEDGSGAPIDRAATSSCRTVGPDIRLTVVAMPGLYDPDVEVRVSSAPGLDTGVPRGKVWTLKSMVRN